MSELPDDNGRNGMSRLPFVLGARSSGIILASLIALIGLLFAWQSSLLDRGSVSLPGPGFFPFVLAITVILLSVVIGIEHWQAPTKGEKITLLHRDVLIVMAASLAVPLVFDWLGALATIALYAAAVLVFVARVPLLLAVMASAAFAGACWFLFQVLLGLQLPSGPF